MSSECLRRSLRKKFRLNVADIARSGQARNPGLQNDDSAESASLELAQTQSPQTDSISDGDKNNEEELRRGNRIRKVPQRIASCYTHDGSSDEDDSVLLSGPFGCDKCPMRFSSRPGLGNHKKFHGFANMDARAIGCPKCDFACINNKPMKYHTRAHELHPYWSAKNAALGASPLSVPPTKTASSASLPVCDTESSASVSTSGQTPPSTPSPPSTLPLSAKIGAVAAPKTRLTKSKEVAKAQTFFVQCGGNSQSSAKITVSTDATSSSSSNSAVATPVIANISDTPVGVALRASADIRPYTFCPSSFSIPLLARMYCPDCPFTSKVAATLSSHCAAHKRQDGSKCAHCSFRSTSANVLKRHSLLHKKKSLAKKKRPSKESLAKKSKRKLLSAEPNIKQLYAPRSSVTVDKCRWKCPISTCAYSSRFMSELIYHKVHRHNMKVGFDFETLTPQLPAYPRFLCKICGITVASFNRYFLHQRLRHSKPYWSPAEKKRWLGEALNGEEVDTDTCDTRSENNMEVKLEDLPLIEKVEPMDVAQQYSNSESTASKQETEDGETEPPILSVESLEDKDLKMEDSDSQHVPFNCDFCPYTTKQLSRLKRHRNKHLIKSDHQCPYCSFSCRDKELWTQHKLLHSQSYLNTPSEGNSPVKGMTRSHSVPTSLSSVISEEDHKEIKETAEVESATDKKRMSPVRFVDEDGVKKVRCPYCPYATRHSCDMKVCFVRNRQILLQQHQAMHEGEKREHACNYCSYSSKRFMSLRSHLLLHGKTIEHPSTTNVFRSVKPLNKKRPVIHRSFGRIGEVRHSNHTRIYYCVACPYSTRRCTELWRHFRYFSPPHRSQRFRRHLFTSSKSTRCFGCSFSSIVPAVLSAHVILHPCTGKPNPHTQGGNYTCDVCPFAADSYGKLWNHREKHKKQSKFQCTQCTFSSGSLTSLHQHMLLHGEQKFKCRFADCSHFEETYDAIQKHYESVHAVSGQARRPLLSDSSLLLSLPQKERSTPSGSDAPDLDCMDGPPVLQQQTTISRDSASAEPDNLSSPSPMESDFELKPELIMQILRPMALAASSSSSGSSCLLHCDDNDCPFEESDKLLYQLHRELHQNRRLMRFKCKMCTFGCHTPVGMLSHLEQHFGLKNGRSRPTSSLRGKLSLQNNLSNGDRSPVLSCTWCKLYTSDLQLLEEHHKEHLKSDMNSMRTAIRRPTGANDDEWTKPRLVDPHARRTEKLVAICGHASSLQLYCRKCRFECKSALIFQRHSEMHGDQCLFVCRYCDYSSNTANVVKYHEVNHHVHDPSAKHSVYINSETLEKTVMTREEKRRLKSPRLRCERCSLETTNVAELSDHFSREHVCSSEDRVSESYLRLGLVPLEAVLPPASC